MPGSSAFLTPSQSISDFEDLAHPLAVNHASSFIHDTAVRSSICSRSKSFVTQQDVVDGGTSPTQARRRLGRSISSLGESTLWDNSELGIGDDEDWVLSSEYLRFSSYESLLLASDEVLRAMHSATGNAQLPANHPSIADMEAMRRRLRIPPQTSSHMVHLLVRTLEKHGAKIRPESALFRLYLIEESVTHTLETTQAGSTSHEDASNLKVCHELRHLSVFAYAIHCIIRLAATTPEGSTITETQAGRLSTHLTHDVRKLSASIVAFRRSVSTEGAEGVRAHIASIAIRYSQPPFVRSSRTHTAPVKTHHIPQSDPPTPVDDAICGASTDDLVLTADDGDAAVNFNHAPLTLLNVSGDQEEPEVKRNSTDKGDCPPQPPSQPCKASESVSMTPEHFGAAAGSTPTILYEYPLNVMMYTTLLHTFFSDDESDSFHGDTHGSAAAAATSILSHTPEKKEKRSVHLKQHTILRTRRQESRMKDVVDALGIFREVYEVTCYLHAACFVHTVFAECLEGGLSVAEMYHLLSIDCYYYPGMKSLCEATQLNYYERTCRVQVVSNLRDDILNRLSDYHAEFADAPEDLLFIIKLYAIISHLPITRPRRNPDLDHPVLYHRGGSTNRITSYTTHEDELEPKVGRRQSQQQRPPPKKDEDPGGGELHAALQSVASIFGEEIEEMVREIMQDGGAEEAAMQGLSMHAYTELVSLVLLSSYKHYIRLKHKVVASRKGGADHLRGFDMWLGQLSCSVGKKTAMSNESLLSLKVALGDRGWTGAARLAPGNEMRRGLSTPSLHQINKRLRLNIHQSRHLLEVMLLELHADTKYYITSIIGVIPSAATITSNLYFHLIKDEVSASLEALAVTSPPPLPLPSSLLSAKGEHSEQHLTLESYGDPSGAASDTSNRVVSTVSLGEAQVQVNSQQGASQPSVSSPQCRPLSPQSDGALTPIPPSSPAPVPPPLPKRSTSPPNLPGLRCSSRGSFTGNTVSVASDDIVALSLLNTNLVYTMLVIDLLRVNVLNYIATLGKATPSDKGDTSSEQTPPMSAPLPVLKQRSDVKEGNSTRANSLSLLTRKRNGHEAFSTIPSMSKNHGLRVEPLLEYDPTGYEVDVSVGSHVPGRLKSSIDWMSQQLQGQILEKWRVVAKTALEGQLQRVVEVDTYESVGTMSEEVLSSSAVDIVSHANRTAVLVSHGITTTWEALKTTRAATNIEPLSPDDGSDEHLCNHFTNCCDGSIARIEDECRRLLVSTLSKFSDLITAPLDTLFKDSGTMEVLDPRRLRHEKRDIFLSDSNSMVKMATRANNILFARQRLHEVHTRVVAAFQLVHWRTTDQAKSGEGKYIPRPPPSFESPSRCTSPLSPIFVYSPGSPTVSFDSQLAAASENGVRKVMMFMASKLVVFDMQPSLGKLHTDPSYPIDDMLATLSPMLREAITFLMPENRRPFNGFTLGCLSQSIAGKLSRGKMQRGKCHKLELFRQLIDDLRALRTFFTEGEGGPPYLLPRAEVAQLTSSMLSIILVVLSTHPTALLSSSFTPTTPIPFHLQYSRGEIIGMMDQLAGRCPLACEYLYEALDLQHAEMQTKALGVQKTRVHLPNSLGQMARAPLKTGSLTAPNDKADKKKTTSKVCTVQ